MRRLRVRKKIKISNIMFIIIGLIFFFTGYLFRIYNKNLNPKLIEVAEIKITKFTESFLSNNIGYDLIKDVNIEDILIINKNKDGEILYVDYDLKRSYQVLETITKELNERISDLENGEFSNIKDRNIKASKSGLVMELPMLIASDYGLLSNLGPKIYLNINFVGALLTNIKSKITGYGMNNALLELYVTVQITEELISPVTKNSKEISYDVLVASKVINGRVPEFYGGIIEEKSNMLSIPLTE